jgi:hypothetical protein
MSFVYHITREDNNSWKLLKVASKGDLLSEIKLKFGCDQFRVQYAVSEEGIGEVYVDMDSIEDLPNKGKLQIVPNRDMPELPSAPQELHEPVTPTPPSPVAETTQQSQATTPTTAQHSQHHLNYYCLPKFPKDVQQQLDAKKSSILVDRSMRAKIIRVLYADLLDKVGWLVGSLLIK